MRSHVIRYKWINQFWSNHWKTLRNPFIERSVKWSYLPWGYHQCIWFENQKNKKQIMNFNHFCEKRTIQLFILAIAITSAATLQRIISIWCTFRASRSHVNSKVTRVKSLLYSWWSSLFSSWDFRPNYPMRKWIWVILYDPYYIEFKLAFDESWQLLHLLYQLPHGTYDRIRLLNCSLNKFNQLWRK